MDQLDQLDEHSIQRRFQTAVQEVSQIDVLVNTGHVSWAKDWTSTTADAFHRQLHNLTGYFFIGAAHA
jgi:NADP-dependent 3-hydroxy acid dehydrogenase YdfG